MIKNVMPSWWSRASILVGVDPNYLNIVEQWSKPSRVTKGDQKLPRYTVYRDYNKPFIGFLWTNQYFMVHVTYGTGSGCMSPKNLLGWFPQVNHRTCYIEITNLTLIDGNVYISFVYIQISSFIICIYIYTYMHRYSLIRLTTMHLT